MKNTYQTPARRALLDFFAAHSDRHYTAEQLCCALCDTENAPRIGKSTVYRQLAHLCDQKQLRRFEDVDADGAAVHVYQYAADADCEHHFHLKCLGCGQIAHLNCDHTEHLLEHIRAAHDFSVDCGNSILYGLCARCARAVSNKEDFHA